MLPDPLHPAIVHLPLALALLSPFVALLGAVAIVRGWVPTRTWAAVVLLQALLAGSAWLALETGEDQEERVEEVVGEAPLEDHEEAAERFLAIAVAGMAVSVAGLLPGRGGRAGRLASVAGGVAILAAAVAVGHSGGALVYEHGAAQVYLHKAAGEASVAGIAEDGASDSD